MSRKYFFREGYNLEELKKRISISDIRDTDLAAVQNLIDKPSNDVTTEDMNKNEQEIHRTLERKLTDTQRYNFYTDIIDECGDKGDIFNLQFIFADSIEEESLVGNIENNKRDEDPSNLIDSKIGNSIIEYKQRENGIIDIKFVVPNEPESYEIDNPSKYPEVIEDFYLEARIYCEEGVIAHSRRAVSDDEIDVLWTVLNTLCGGQLQKRPSISTNEMLAVQNAMDGENHGINYGDFDGGRNINKARYRGTNNLDPSDSYIVSPAAESGEITGLLFYHTYKSGRKSRDILIRLYNDAHITCSNIHTEPDLINDLVSELARVKKHENLLITINKITSGYKYKILKNNLVESYGSYLSDINQDLRAISDEHLPMEDIEKVERSSVEVSTQDFLEPVVGVESQAEEVQIAL